MASTPRISLHPNRRQQQDMKWIEHDMSEKQYDTHVRLPSLVKESSKRKRLMLIAYEQFDEERV